MCEGEKKRRGHAVAVVWYFCWMEDSKTSGEFKSLKAIDRQFCIARYSNSPSVLSQGVNKFKVESLRQLVISRYLLRNTAYLTHGFTIC